MPEQATTPQAQPTKEQKEEMAGLIRAIWEALLLPDWQSKDLIELGKLIYAKVPLRDVDPELFQRLLPNLSACARQLSTRVTLRRPAAPPAAPQPEASGG
jgi:hypothetical protein